MAYGIVQDTPELKALCSSVESEQTFIKALAEHFLHEPALSARAEVYQNLGLPPPDESGEHRRSRGHDANEPRDALAAF